MIVGVVIGGVIGLVIGIYISCSFIFPADILALKLVNMTIGDILRILGGLTVIANAAGFGALFGLLATTQKD